MSNLLDPVLLIGLSWLATHNADTNAEGPASSRWHMRLEIVAGIWLPLALEPAMALAMLSKDCSYAR
jgi:hypothetical protein